MGCTLLLANVGAALAAEGRRVLLWDLDVEAPGMHRIPALTPEPLASRGFLEWLLDWQNVHRMKDPGRKLIEAFDKFIYSVPRIGSLSIHPAFGEKADSAELYRKIRWHEFLAHDPARGLHLFEGLVDHLATGNLFDHILLDARTGITDLGGLMAAVLPDATVLVGS